MRSTDGALDFEATIQDINFNSVISSMENRIRGFSSTAARETSKVQDVFSRLGQLATGAFVFRGLTELPQQLLKVRSEFQGLEISFSTMLRSKAAANTLLASLAQEAATTPFGLKDVASGAKQLLAYGFSVNELIPTMRRLGDVASGTGDSLNHLLYVYGTLRTQGRAYTKDIQQFAAVGVPIYDSLAKVLAVNVDRVAEFVENGKVGFKEVELAFKNMTSSGGLFAGLMDAQSKSLSGLTERLGDAYDKMLNEIGTKNQGIAEDLLITAGDVVAHYQDVIDILKVVAAGYGGAKAALVIYTVAQRLASLEQIRNAAVTEAQAIAQAEAASAGAALTLSQRNVAIAAAQASQAQAAGATLAARAQGLLNAALSVNPYVLAGTAIAALVTYLVVFREETLKIKTAQEAMADTGKEVSSKFRQQSGEVKTLIGVIKNQNIAESERLKAYEKLKTVAPDIIQGLDFQKAKTADLTKATNDYITALRQRLQLEAGQGKLKDLYDQDADAAKRLKEAEDALLANKNNTQRSNLGMGQYGMSQAQAAQLEYDNAVAFKKKTEAELKKAEDNIGRIYGGTSSKQELEANISRQERIIAGITDKLSPAYKYAEDALVKYREELAKVIAAEKVNQKAQADSINEIEAKIKVQQEKLGEQRSTADAAVVQAEIKRLQEQLRRLKGEQSDEEKKLSAKAKKDAEKSGPYGSIDYWEQISKKASEILEKLPASDTSGIAKQAAIKFNADKQVEDLRKQYVIKSFSDELDEKRAQYELYQRWVENYGKESADAQFSTLLKSGRSYLENLNNEISKLETKQKTSKLSDEDTKNLNNLVVQRDDIKGKKSPLDKFQEGLEKARQSAGNLADYLVILKQKQDELGKAKAFSGDDFKIREQLAQEVVNTEAELQNRLQQFLISSAGTAEQFLAIQNEYAEKRAAIDKRFNGNRGEDYKQAIKVVDEAEKQALEDFRQRRFEETEEYKNTTKVILEEGEKRIAEEIRLQKIAVAKALETDGINSEVYKRAKQRLEDLNKQAGGTTIQKFIGDYASIIGEFGQALSQLGGTASIVGGILTGLSSSLNLVLQSMEKGISDAKKTQIAVQAAASFAISIINTIASASAQRRQAEAQYEKDRLSAQLQYNQLLVQQIGLQSKLNESVFLKDYAGQAQDGINQLSKAEENLETTLEKLRASGKSKTGQRDAVDWGSVAQLAVSGAALGTVIPGVGNVVGAVGGAIVGGLVALFGGKKKEDVFGDLLSEYPELIDMAKGLNVELATTLLNTNQVDDATKLLLQDAIDWTKQVEAAREQIRGIISDLAGSLGNDIRNGLVSAFEDGTSAAKAFGDSVSKVLENVLSNLLFNAIFAKKFKELEQDLAVDFDTNAGANPLTDITKTLGEFFQGSGDQIALMNAALATAQAQAKQYGLDIFKPTTPTQANALSGSIKSLTEETGSVIAGQMNAMRIQQADTNRLINQQLVVLSSIDRNTGGTNSNTAKTNELLDRIGSTIKGLDDGLRAKGIL